MIISMIRYDNLYDQSVFENDQVQLCMIISKIRCDNLYEQSIFENEDWSLSL